MRNTGSDSPRESLMQVAKSTHARTKRPLRVLLADEHALIRAGIRSLLEQSPAFKVVAEAENSGEMLRFARRLRPDIIVMESSLPNDDGIHATARLHQLQQPRVPVILLAPNTNGHEALRAMKASASGYLMMTSRPVELRKAIRQVMNGRTYLDPSLVHAKGLRGVIVCEGGLPQRPVLSRRQRETLRLLAEGKNTKEIAAFLRISPKTVDFHRVQLMNRLKTHTVAGLVRDAIRLGLIKRM
jgi:DNA-binding NarL/FixJ family response regulator